MCKIDFFHHIFGASQEEIVNVHADLEDHFVKSKTVPRCSHHFVSISCNNIAHKLTSGNREFLQFDFDKSLTTEIDIKNIKCFLYVSCIYDTFWWAGRVTEVNVHESVSRLNFFTHMDLGKLPAGHLLLINVLSQHQTFYALSQLQQQSPGKCI